MHVIDILAILPLGVYLREILKHMYQEICKRTLMAALPFIGWTWGKKNNYPSIGEQINCGMFLQWNIEQWEGGNYSFSD